MCTRAEQGVEGTALVESAAALVESATHVSSVRCIRRTTRLATAFIGPRRQLDEDP